MSESGLRQVWILSQKQICSKVVNSFENFKKLFFSDLIMSDAVQDRYAISQQMITLGISVFLFFFCNIKIFVSSRSEHV